MDTSELIPPEILDFIADDRDDGAVLETYVEERMTKMLEAILEFEVTLYCGQRRKRDGLEDGRYHRWSYNEGTVRFKGLRLEVKVPRIRDTQEGRMQPLKLYRRMHQFSPKEQEKIARALYLGLSQRDYHRPFKEIRDIYGLSSSSVNRLFVEYSARVLAEYEQRELSKHTYVALLIDGKYMRGRQVIFCMGITAEGKKQILGYIEAETENAEAIKGLLQELIELGLKYEEGLLCIIDGAQGLRKAVGDVFGSKAQVQRCTQHKRENVKSHLKDEEEKEQVDRRMREAYEKDSYQEARAELLDLKNELTANNEQAANSLEEGLEETLTLHRLEVAQPLRRSLRTTNIIENFNGLFAERIRRIDRWTNSDQRHRWTAMAIKMEVPRLKGLAAAEHLLSLQETLRKCAKKPYTDAGASPGPSP